MTNAVTAPKTLQERVGDRIKEQIGELMTDEDMKLLVDKAMHEAFFTPTKIPKQGGGWNAPDQYADAFAVAHVKKLLESRVDAACKAWLEVHKDEFGKHIDDAVGAGFSTLMVAWLDGKTHNALVSFGAALQSQMGMPR